MNINYNKLVSKDVRNYYLYFLFLNKILIYIGQTAHLNSRLVAHKGKRVRNDTPYKKYTHYYYIESKSDYLSKKWEKILIKKWCPKYNIGHNDDAKFRKIWIERKLHKKIGQREISSFWRYLEK